MQESNEFRPGQNAGQRAGLTGAYDFNKPHSSYRSRLRRLRQIARGQLSVDQLDMSGVNPSATPRPVMFIARDNPEFEMTVLEENDAENRPDHDADDRSAVEPRPENETAEEAESVSGE